MNRRAALLFFGLASLGACSNGAPAPVVAAPAASAATPPPASPAVEVDVTGPNGAPIAGALVSAWSHFDLESSDPAHDERSDAQGRAHFSLPPGRHALTATSPSLVGAYSGVVDVLPRGAPLHISLRLGSGGATFEGRVLDEHGAPLADGRVVAPALSENEFEVYVTRTDNDGRYVLRLPAGSDYFVVADAPPRRRVFARAENNPKPIDLRFGPLPAPRPADEAITTWLRVTATPFAPGQLFDAAAAAAFAKIVGDAKIVAMGEATHGSSEFSRDRMRVFQALVRDKGVTVYAGEIGWADAFALDDWIQTGRGDVNKAIHGLLNWKDDTTETLELVQWMRAYNADPTHKRKLHFEGFDVLTPHAVPLLLAYLKKVEAGFVDEASHAVAPFAALDSDLTYPELPPDVRAKTRVQVDAFVAHFDANHAAYAKRSSEAEWARARQLARMIQQADRSYGDYPARDAFLAENVDWLVAHHEPGARFVLNAHNGHIAAENHSLLYMGRLLREKYGKDYVTVGFAFGEGSFRALDRRPDVKNGGLGEFSIGRPLPDTLDATLARAGIPIFIVDLRAAPAPIAAWLRSPQRMHHVGGIYRGADAVLETYAPLGAFDAVIYEDRITAIHPLVHPR